MTQLQAEDDLLAFALAITLIRHKHVGSGVQFHPDDLATEVNSLKWGDNVDLQLNTSALQQALFKFKKVIRNDFLCLDELVVMGRTKYGPDLTPAFGDYASKKSGYEIKWNSSYEFAEEQSTTDLDLFELVGKVRTCRDHILQRAGLAPSCFCRQSLVPFEKGQPCTGISSLLPVPVVESDVWVNSYKPWSEMKSRQQHKIGQKVLEKVCEGLGGKNLALPKDHEYVSGVLTVALRCTKMEKKRKRDERTCVDDSGDVADGEDEDGDSDYESNKQRQRLRAAIRRRRRNVTDLLSWRRD